MRKVGPVTEIFSNVGRVAEIFYRSKTFIVSNSLFLIYSLNAFSLLNITTVNYSQPCLDANQSEPSVNPSTLVVGPMMELSFSVVLAGNSPKSVKFGLSETTELLTKSILSCA